MLLLFLFPVSSLALDFSIDEMEKELSELKKEREAVKNELIEMGENVDDFELEENDQYDASPEIQKNFEVEEPESKNYKGKVLEIKEKPEPMKVEILNGDRKGEEIKIENNLKGNPYNLKFEQGDKVFINILKYKGQEEQYIIKDFYHLDWLFIWLFIFIIAVLILGKKKGALALLSLGLSVALVFFCFIPLVKAGYNPILLTLLVCIVVSMVALIIITGFTRKTVVAILGTLSGILAATLLVLLMGWFMRLTGLSSETNRIIAGSFPDLDFKYIFYSGVIIGALGAVMDIAVSIASAQKEIKNHKADVSRKKLIKSGLNIGRDVLGSMINTLIFAYIGTSLSMVLMFTESGLSLMEILNLGSISEEIARSLVGSLGLLISIPLTAILGGVIYSLKKNK